MRRMPEPTADLRVVMLSLHTSPLAQAGTGDAGGLNVYVNALSAALAARGVDVDIVTTDLDGPDRADTVTELEDGRRLHVLPVAQTCQQDKNRLLECLDDLARRAEQSLLAASSSPVSVVHSHYWISGLAGMQLAESMGAQLVHTMHTIGQVKQERDPSVREDPRRHAAETRIAASASVLTANTERDAADLVRVLKVAESSVVEVRPGVNLDVFHPPRDGDERRGPLEGRPLRLTFAGRLQQHKGPHVAVAAVGRLSRLYPDQPVELTIAGRQSGPDAVDIHRLAEAEGIADRITFLEPLPHPRLAELFRSSDAVLVPSYSESFGLVALEALACGTPVLAHDVGGLSELVAHRRTGRLIGTLDPEDWVEQMRWLIIHRKAWGRYSETAAHLAAQHSWDDTAASAMDAYCAAVPALCA